MRKKIFFFKGGAIVVVCIQVCICHDQQWRWLTSIFLWTSPPTNLVGVQKLGHFTLWYEAIFPNSCNLKGNRHYKPCLIWSKFIKTKQNFNKNIVKTNYANMSFIKYMLFICMSKNENSKPKEYYAHLILFSNQIDHIKIFITIKYNKIMKKITKLNEIKHQKKLLLFSISQKHN
jgi:hypothetical protein